MVSRKWGGGPIAQGIGLGIFVSVIAFFVAPRAPERIPSTSHSVKISSTADGKKKIQEIFYFKTDISDQTLHLPGITNFGPNRDFSYEGIGPYKTISIQPHEAEKFARQISLAKETDSAWWRPFFRMVGLAAKPELACSTLGIEEGADFVVKLEAEGPLGTTRFIRNISPDPQEFERLKGGGHVNWSYSFIKSYEHVPYEEWHKRMEGIFSPLYVNMLERLHGNNLTPFRRTYIIPDQAKKMTAVAIEQIESVGDIQQRSRFRVTSLQVVGCDGGPVGQAVPDGDKVKFVPRRAASTGLGLQ